MKKNRPEYDHAVFDVLHTLKDKSASEIAKNTYLSSSTIRKWRKGPKYGGTRYPLHHTLAEAARFAGFKWILTKEKK